MSARLIGSARRAFRTPVLFIMLALLVGLAGLVAAGCGGDDKDKKGVAASGGLGYVPEDAVGVMLVSLKEEDLDRSIKTLDRLPAWSLVETQLPSTKAEKLFEMLGDEGLKGDPDTKKLTYKKDIKPWLGDTAGGALLGDAVDDPKSLEGDDVPALFWVDSTDDDKAREFAKTLVGKKHTTSKHEGVEIYKDPEEDGVVFVNDGAMVLASSVKAAKKVIDGEDKDDFADTKYVKDMLDTSDRNEQVVAVASTERILELSEAGAKASGDPDLEKFAGVLGDDAVRDLLPDVVAMSGGLDDVGVWFDTSWAPAGKPGITDARELAGRVPASAYSVSASGSQSEVLEQIPDVWKSVKDAYDIDLEGLADECDPEEKALCELFIKTSMGVLEGDLIEKSMKVAGDDGATVQYSALADTGFAQQIGVIQRVASVADSNKLAADAMELIAPALKPYGLDLAFTEQGDDATFTVKVPLKSQAGIALVQAQKQMKADAAMSPTGLDPTAQYKEVFTQLLSPKGLSLDLKAIDDTTQALAFPNDQLDGLVSAWNGDADQLADDEAFMKDIKAAGAPKDTSSFGWLSYSRVFEGMAAQAKTDPSMAMLKNNLTNVGGFVFWSERRGRDVGVVRLVMPIHK